MLTTAALLLAGALGVHELRYVLGFGGEADAALAHHGHGYLAVLLPVSAALSALALAVGLLRAAAAPALHSAASVRMRRLCPAASAALLAIYVSQELVEGLLAPGHPAGWAGVFGAGGWIAIPLSVGFGTLIALGLRVAHAVRSATPLDIAAMRLAPQAPQAHVAGPPAIVWRRSGRLLADHLAGRAPPLVSV